MGNDNTGHDQPNDYPAAGGRPIVFISAAEPSADLHGASLIEAVRAIRPDIRFVGVAGPRMVASGCESIFDMTGHAAMLINALGAAGRAWKLFQATERFFQANACSAAVVIDSPTLHLPMADWANRLGIPVLYYVAPQLWAWGAHRIYKLRHTVRHVAAILPFEEAYFRNQGVQATFVGHPLADSVRQRPVDRAIVDSLKAQGQPVVGLLPGSRRQVVEQVFPGQLEVAKRILGAFPRALIGVSVAGPTVSELIDTMIRRSGLPIESAPAVHRELIAASDLVLAASGTTTLEVAFHHTPMIVMYNASRLLYNLIGRWIVRLPHYSLPNILAGRVIVPEFMPYYTSTEPIAAKALELLGSPSLLEDMSGELADVVAPLVDGHASRNTAEILLDIFDDH